MAYIVGQYNHNNASSDDASFISPITTGRVARYSSSSGTSLNSSASYFTDECITGLNLNSSGYYYFRCQIKRMVMPQTFTIKLINYNSSSSTEQFIKQVTIQGGDRQEWTSIDFIFNPVITFDTILFQLQRTVEDYQGVTRYPKIAYQQLGIINNIINTKIRNNISLLKIGVQSHPGLSMCINGEEIHISKSGIFEIKSGVIPIDFFSVVNPAIEVNQDPTDPNSIEGWKQNINQQIEAIENDPSLTIEQKIALYASINSRCFFGTSKNYKIDAFTLDYMYNN